MTCGAGVAENVPVAAPVAEFMNELAPLMLRFGDTLERLSAKAWLVVEPLKSRQVEVNTTSLAGGVASWRVALLPFNAPPRVPPVLKVPDNRLVPKTLSMIEKVPANPSSSTFEVPITAAVWAVVAVMLSVAVCKDEPRGVAKDPSYCQNTCAPRGFTVVKVTPAAELVHMNRFPPPFSRNWPICDAEAVPIRRTLTNVINSVFRQSLGALARGGYQYQYGTGRMAAASPPLSTDLT